MKSLHLLLPALLAAACTSRTPVPVSADPLVYPWRPSDVLRAHVPRAAGGAIVVDDRDGLSPDEAALMAIEHNPRLRAIRDQRGIASAEILSAGVLPNPRVDIGLDFPLAKSGEVRKPLGFGGGVSWNVTGLMARSPKVASANEAAAAIDLEVAWQEWQVAQAARLSAARAIFAERRIASAGEIERSWRERVGAYRDAVAKNAATTLDLANAERALAEAAVAKLDYESEAIHARGDLRIALGVAPGSALRMEAEWHPPHLSVQRDELLADLPSRRLDLIGVRHGARSHDEAHRAAMMARFPPVDIGVAARRDVEGVATGTATITFDLPFFDRNQGGVARAAAQRRQADDDYDARLAEARSLVTVLMDELDVAERRMRASSEAAEISAKLATVAKQAAVAGTLPVVTASDLEQQSFAVRIRAITAEQGVAEVVIALAMASGKDLR